MEEFDIYSDFIDDNNFATLPFLNVEETSTDLWIRWSPIRDRLDKIAYKYYNNAKLGKLLLLANPQFICETDLDEGDIFRIPFPKESLFSRINEQIRKAKGL